MSELVAGSMPRQGADLNSGVYGTPLDFLKMVDETFPITFDLAASAENCAFHRVRWWPEYGDEKKYHFDVADDALSQPWTYSEKLVEYGFKGNGWMWLNPPYSNIAPWAKKCAEESALGARILMLVPQGSQKWNREYCQGKSLELRIDGRLTFEGSKDPYPKDLTLFVFGAGMVGSGFLKYAPVKK